MPLEPGRSRNVISHNIREMQEAGHPHDQAVAAALSNADRHPRAGGGFTPSLGAIEAALAIARQPVHRPQFPHVHEHTDRTRAPEFHPPSASHQTPGIEFHGGLIDAAVHGRTDKIPLNVPSGSYVLPADIVSALGQGNTRAGAEVIQQVVGGAPYQASSGGAYGAAEPPGARGSGPPGPHLGGGAPAPPPNAEHLGDVAGPEPPQMAAGGNARREGSHLVPIIAAGGEYVLSPRDVAWLGDGDLARGHGNLDQFVVRVREKLRDTLSKLKPPKKD